MTVPPGFPVNDQPLIGTWPRVVLQIAWNAGGNSTSPNHWYTVSKRLRGSWKAAASGRQYEMDAVQAGTMTFALDNLDGAFDPDNASSFFYPNVVPYRRCRMILVGSPTRNLMFPWIANGTSLYPPQGSNAVGTPPNTVAASTGTLGTATGLTPSASGLTTAITWAIPNGAASNAVFGLNGVTQSWSTTDCQGITVTPGASYALGVDLALAAGGMTSLGLQLQIAFYTLAGSFISGPLSSSVSVTTSGARLTVAGTAPSNAAFGLLAVGTTAATTAATTVQITGVQLEQAAASTAWTAAGPWDPIWQGFVERWPQKYQQNGKYGLVEVTAVDALAPLSQLTMSNVMPTWVKLQSPQYNFDLASTTTSPDVINGTAFPELGGSGAALDIVGSAITTGASISSATSLGTLWNTPGPVITLTNNQASSQGSNANCTYLRPWTGSSSIMLPGTGGWTRMLCFRTSTVPGTGGTYTIASLWDAMTPGYLSATGDQSGVYVYITNTGVVAAVVQRSDGTYVSVWNQSVSVCDGNWHCVVVSLSADGKTVHNTVDNYYAYTTAAVDLHSTTYTTDVIGTLLNSSGTNNQPFNGDLAWFGQWNTELSLQTQLDLANGFATGWAGEATGSRAARVLKLAAFNPGSLVPGRYIGTAGALGSVAMTGRSPLEVIQEAADTEVSQFAVDYNGAPNVYGHLWRWMQSVPLATFGENTASGEVPYTEDVIFEQDPAHLFNDVQITCDGAADGPGTVEEAFDAPSQAAYFPQTLSRTINPQTVQGGLNIANYLLSQYKDPHTRIQGITVDLASDASRLAKVAGLHFSDLVRVMRRPTLAPVKQLDCFIEQMEWSGDDTGANLRLHLQMSPVSQYRYWMISAAWASLTAGIAAGVSTITVGPVSGNNGIAAQYVIPSGSGYQMTLGYGTANSETVTISSVQAVSPGYSTVQITFTAATTKSHAANDYLCDPLPSVALPPQGGYPTCFDAVSQIGGTTPLIGF